MYTTHFVGLKTLLIYFNPLKPSKTDSQLKQISTEKTGGNPPLGDRRQETAHNWELYTSKHPKSPTSQPPTPIHTGSPWPPNLMPVSNSWMYFPTLVSVLTLLTVCGNPRGQVGQPSCLGHLISLSWGVSQEALTRLSKLYTSAPLPFVKAGDSLALSLCQGYYEGEIGQVFIKLKNLWTPETTFVNPSVSCHIDNRS